MLQLSWNSSVNGMFCLLFSNFAKSIEKKYEKINQFTILCYWSSWGISCKIIPGYLTILPEQTEPRILPLLVSPEVLHANTAAVPSGPQYPGPSPTLERRFFTVQPDAGTLSNSIKRSFPHFAFNVHGCAIFSHYFILSIREALWVWALLFFKKSNKELRYRVM